MSPDVVASMISRPYLVDLHESNDATCRAVSVHLALELRHRGHRPGAYTRPLFQLIISTFRGIRRVVSLRVAWNSRPMVYNSQQNWTQNGSPTITAQVELRSAREEPPARDCCSVRMSVPMRRARSSPNMFTSPWPQGPTLVHFSAQRKHFFIHHRHVSALVYRVK
jgi:hypothetical protein